MAVVAGNATNTTLKTRIQLRSNDKNTWTSSNSDKRLLKGEVGVELDSSGTGSQNDTKIKIGDGSKTWSNLPYATMSQKELTSNGMVYRINTQEELDAQIETIFKTGGRVILGKGEFVMGFGYTDWGEDGDEDDKWINLDISQNTIFEGMGIESTQFEVSFRDKTDSNPARVVFRDMTLCPRLSCDSVYITNCLVTTRVLNRTTNQSQKYEDNAYIFEFGNHGDGLHISDSTIQITWSLDDSWIQDISPSCCSLIATSGDIYVTNCDITIGKGSTGSFDNDYDVNFIYAARNAVISNCVITCEDPRRTNIVNMGNNIITGCSIYLKNNQATICHRTTLGGIRTGTFTGNYVEYYATRLSFATVTGNTFVHKGGYGTDADDPGTGEKPNGYNIVLECDTNMTGNTFVGEYRHYIDCQNHALLLNGNLSNTKIEHDSTSLVQDTNNLSTSNEVHSS